ncbi:DUF2141 domain-containing protein [uncultured Hymenobacter sp.]|uniref:DUF2141 domain-containing protein n=1 Tax=uncultured Hymenobacter sp. TaxID=170016 RepID=UPI0035C99716
MFALSLVSLMVPSSCLQNAPAAAQQGPARPASTQSVTVVVSDLVSTQSTVKLYFYNAASSFLKRGQYVFSRFVKPGGKREISLPVDLPKGEWAVVITQDTNNNDKLDKNFLGIPTEPYAFSNNVRPTVAPPKFHDCKFMVNDPGKVVSIVLKK